jgi:hypothetical protein
MSFATHEAGAPAVTLGSLEAVRTTLVPQFQALLFCVNWGSRMMFDVSPMTSLSVVMDRAPITDALTVPVVIEPPLIVVVVGMVPLFNWLAGMLTPAPMEPVTVVAEDADPAVDAEET